MPKLTKHSEKRIFERMGASNYAAKKNVEKALNMGITHKETFGELEKWLDGKFLGHRSHSDRMRIYNGYLYVFTNKTLVTVYALPDEIAAIIPDCVSPKVYERYLRPSLKAQERRSAKADMDYEKKLLAFRRLVLLNDIRSFADGRYPVEITGVGIERVQVRIYYIPKAYDFPDLSGIAEYVKYHTKYKSVRFIHKKDMDGNLEYY